MIKKTNLQNLLTSIQEKINSKNSKTGQNQKQSQKESLLNYNKGLDSTEDWGGMVSISK